MQLFPHDPELLFRAGIIYEQAGDLTRSEQAYLTLLTNRETGHIDSLDVSMSVAYPIGKVLSYSYDENGNRIQLQQSGGNTDYSYDANNNLTEIVNPYSETTSFSYDALDQEEQKTLANGVTVKSTFDAAGRKVLLEQRKADTTALAIYTATYDAVGIRTSTQELDGSVNDYSYDATYQLLNETRSETNAFSTTFTYDPTGNRLTQDADGTLTTSTYDAANQLLTAMTNGEVTTFSYDANGNQTEGNANGTLSTYTWDAENRMTGADDGTNTETFIYAGDGQRPNRLLINIKAALDNEYLYKAFGEKVLSTGSIRNPFQFQGQVGPYFDADNRSWMRSRIYNPVTGRWDSQDPIGFDGKDWNLFRFVGNNPIRYIDPNGYFSISDAIKSNQEKIARLYVSPGLQTKLLHHYIWGKWRSNDIE